MAELSCIDSVKGRTRVPSTLAQEVAAQPSIFRSYRVRDNPNRLYTIEVVEEEEHRVKVHYTGYSSRYDEWIRRSDIVFQAPKPPTEEPDFSLMSTLACSIKKQLAPSRKEVDSAVRIQLPFDKAGFQMLAEKGKPLGKSLGHERYSIQQYSDLNELLGDKWHLRIVNINGDFSYVVLETVRFYLTHPKPILDFDVVHDGTSLKFIPMYIEQGYSLIFSFVRGDGNSRKLRNFL